MDVATEASAPNAGLLDWLRVHHIEYEVHEHPLAFTARETARAEGVDPRTFAKTLAVLTADGRRFLVVLDATDHLDLVKARRVLDTGHVRLLTEEELLEISPDCAVGTLPPIGALCGMPVIADYAVREDPEISFHAGSHRYSIRVDRAGWEHAAEVRYADLAEDVVREPAWVRS